MGFLLCLRQPGCFLAGRGLPRRLPSGGFGACRLLTSGLLLDPLLPGAIQPGQFDGLLACRRVELRLRRFSSQSAWQCRELWIRRCRCSSDGRGWRGLSQSRHRPGGHFGLRQSARRRFSQGHWRGFDRPIKRSRRGWCDRCGGGHGCGERWPGLGRRHGRRDRWTGLGRHRRHRHRQGRGRRRRRRRGRRRRRQARCQRRLARHLRLKLGQRQGLRRQRARRRCCRAACRNQHDVQIRRLHASFLPGQSQTRHAAALAAKAQAQQQQVHQQRDQQRQRKAMADAARLCADRQACTHDACLRCRRCWRCRERLARWRWRLAGWRGAQARTAITDIGVISARARPAAQRGADWRAQPCAARARGRQRSGPASHRQAELALASRRHRRTASRPLSYPRCCGSAAAATRSASLPHDGRWPAHPRRVQPVLGCARPTAAAQAQFSTGRALTRLPLTLPSLSARSACAAISRATAT